MYSTTDAGQTWKLETVIAVGQPVDRVHVIDNAHKDAKLLITEAGDNSLDIAKRDIFIGRITSK